MLKTSALNFNGTVKFNRNAQRDSHRWEVVVGGGHGWVPRQFEAAGLAEAVGRAVLAALDDTDGGPVNIDIMIDADNGKGPRKLTMHGVTLSR